VFVALKDTGYRGKRPPTLPSAADLRNSLLWRRPNRRFYPLPHARQNLSSTIDRLARFLADRYRIERELGQGGMAIVYLAHDLRHDRKVAVKVMHAELAAALGADRFLAEIRVTANLQHPNILPLLDSGLVGPAPGAARGAADTHPPDPAGGVPYYVMPYVPGDSLRHRLDRERQLPLGEALTITRGVAAALGHAHKQGVIHRDIKPENILLQDGQPVVTDFGIALAVSAAGGQRLTQTGLSLGTPHYMSPEQAMGERHIDARTDVYALGVVTYEMLAGEPPFTGPNSPAVVAKVLTERPRPLATVRDTVPPHVDAAVQMALQKLPADRFSSAAEFVAALATPEFAAPPPRIARSDGRPVGQLLFRVRAIAPWFVATAAVAVVAWSLQRPPPDVDREQWDLVAPDSAPILGDDERNAYLAPAISPDGSLLAYTAARDSSTMLYITRLGTGETRALPETRGGYAPFFAPDGRRLGFLTENQIRLVDVETGKVTVVREGVDAYMGTWTATERIAFLDDGGYGWFDADGSGQVRRLTPHPRVDIGRPWPGITALPGTDQVLVGDFALRIAVVTLSDGSVRYLTTGEASPTPPPLERSITGVWARFVAPHHIVMWRPGAKLLAVRFDPGSLRVTGKPVEVMRGVRVNVAGVSPSGTWAYPPRLAAGGSTLAQLGPAGITRAFPLPPRRYQGVSLSPDGRHVAMRLMSESGREMAEAYDLSRNAALAARIDADITWAPQWNQTGRHLYAANASGVVYRREINTRRQDSTIVPLNADEVFEFDGVVGEDTVVATIGHAGDRDIFLVPFRDPRQRIPLVQRDGDQFQSVVARSGRWLAYLEVDGGTAGLIVEPRPATGQRQRLDVNTGYVWDDDGQLYFVSGGFVNRIQFSVTPNGVMATPLLRVMSGRLLGGEEGRPFVPIDNGRSLVALIAASPPVAHHLVVVRRWGRELERLVK